MVLKARRKSAEPRWDFSHAKPSSHESPSQPSFLSAEESAGGHCQSLYCGTEDSNTDYSFCNVLMPGRGEVLGIVIRQLVTLRTEQELVGLIAVRMRVRRGPVCRIRHVRVLPSGVGVLRGSDGRGAGSAGELVLAELRSHGFCSFRNASSQDNTVGSTSLSSNAIGMIGWS